MNLTFSEAKIQRDNGVWLCLKVNEPAPALKFVMEIKKRLYDLVIKEHREKRSLDANAYYWKWAGELARALNIPPVEVYRRHIRDFGNFETICIQKPALESFCQLWTSGHLGRFVETRESKLEGCVTVLAYYGSSDFDRAEMSRLIDNCIQDCEAVGIETLPPDKLALLKEEWNNAPTDESNRNPTPRQGRCGTA